MTNIEAVLIGLLSATHTPEQAEHAARTVLRDHAHQLAEEIRRDGPDRVTNDDEAAGLAVAADLIDPEAQR